MKQIITTLKITLVATVFLSGCDRSRNTAGKAPGKFELYKFFEKELGQTAKAGGYLNFKVELNRVQEAAPIQCNIPEEGPAPCYPFKIDRTEYLTGYHETYVSKYLGDEYKLYRDRDGKLKIFDHKEGQTKTVQRKSGGMLN